MVPDNGHCCLRYGCLMPGTSCYNYNSWPTNSNKPAVLHDDRAAAAAAAAWAVEIAIAHLHLHFWIRPIAKTAPQPRNEQLRRRRGAAGSPSCRCGSCRASSRRSRCCAIGTKSASRSRGRRRCRRRHAASPSAASPRDADHRLPGLRQDHLGAPAEALLAGMYMLASHALYAP